MNGSALRPAAVAGSWYPAQRASLVAAVERHLAAAVVEPGPVPRAVVAPHAGLMYSGPVAAYSYKAAQQTRYDTIVLVGPSHYVPFRGVSIWPRGVWETPFGPVQVDESLAAAMTTAAPHHISDYPEAHGREHSLELQLPFVAHLWPGARIVPVVMGDQTRQTTRLLAEAIAMAVGSHSARESAAQTDDRVLLVASSDLSHYEDARTAAMMDAVVMQHVESLDPAGLMDALERDRRHACGGGAIVAVLDAARRLGASRARLLHYADSGDVSGDKSSVVGYMAAAIS